MDVRKLRSWLYCRGPSIGIRGGTLNFGTMVTWAVHGLFIGMAATLFRGLLMALRASPTAATILAVALAGSLLAAVRFAAVRNPVGMSSARTFSSGEFAVAVGVDKSAIARLPGLLVYDPYAGEGSYVRCQLHCHSRGSLGSGLSLKQLHSIYAELGFQFVFVTDHSRTPGKTLPQFEGPPVLLSGEENITSIPFFPLGPHLLRLGVTSHCGWGSVQDRIDTCLESGGVAVAAHPTWTGNLGTGQWDADLLSSLRGLRLIEICNHHSNSTRDVRRWHKMLEGGMIVFGVAVDDAKNRHEAGRAWVEVKVDELVASAVLRALERGSFYATRGGCQCQFGVYSGEIVVETESPSAVYFINAENRVVRQSDRCRSLGYAPKLDDGFVRVEVKAVEGTQAWSQPFHIMQR